jgi:hypothetical protein
MNNVSPLEFVWVLVNTITLVFVINGLFDARSDRRAVRLLNGKARELAATGIVRREMMRVTKVALLLSVAVPGLFFPDNVIRPALFRVYPVVALMTLALLLLLQSFWDARDRKAMTVLITEEALGTTTGAALERIETALEHNTEISAEAVTEARRAYETANTINEKIAAQQEAGLAQQDAEAKS